MAAIARNVICSWKILLFEWKVVSQCSSIDWSLKHKIDDVKKPLGFVYRSMAFRTLQFQERGSVVKGADQVLWLSCLSVE